MKPLLNILRKEIKELLTPATFIPVVIIAILFASLGGFMSGITDDLAETPAVGIVDEDNGNLSTIVLDSITSNSKPISLDDNMDINQMLEKVKSSDGTAL